MKRSTLGLILLLSFCFAVISLPKINMVKANMTIYIKVDGSIDPSTAPISSVENITYSFTGLINSSIVVERDNIVIDGTGNVVQGTGTRMGIDLTGRINVTIKRVEIEAFLYGIELYNSSNNRICESSIKNNEYGIHLAGSSSNIISENNITNNRLCGVMLSASSDNILWGNKINNNVWGVLLRASSSYNILFGNKITNNEEGVELDDSPDNIISGNSMENNWAGIGLVRWTDNNSISGNNLTNNKNGVWLNYGYMFNNKFYHNNFINNTKQRAGLSSFFTGNFWDDGYPFGGNYWSDYIGTDEKSGPNQNQPGSDGIGDSYYEIDKDIIDYYPFMGMYSSFNTPSDYKVDIVSNSSVSEFDFSLINSSHARLYFNVIGEIGTKGFCRICIPKALVNDSYTVRFNGEVITYPQVRELPCSNGKYEYLYINYTHSEHRIEISGTITEFPSLSIITLFMMAAQLAVIVYRRKLSV